MDGIPLSDESRQESVLKRPLYAKEKAKICFKILKVKKNIKVLSSVSIE